MRIYANDAGENRNNGKRIEYHGSRAPFLKICFYKRRESIIKLSGASREAAPIKLVIVSRLKPALLYADTGILAAYAEPILRGNL